MFPKRISHRFYLNEYSEEQKLFELMLLGGESKKNVLSQALRSHFIRAKETNSLEMIFGIAVADDFKDGIDIDNVYMKYILIKPADYDEYSSEINPDKDSDLDEDDAALF